MADQATGFFEDSRQKVRTFLGARHGEEIIFTKGVTESLNLVAQSFGDLVLKAGDEILLTEMEHHANIVPWQIAAEKHGAKIKVIPVNDLGELRMDEAEKLLGPQTKILAITHCSNVLGTVNDIKTLSQLAKKHGTYVIVDGAQMVANYPVDVQDLGVDFYAFSAHKIFGPYGTGVLYGKKEHLEKMSPYQAGGSMISEVRFEKTIYNDLPFKFEAGTPNIEGVIALGSAIDYLVHRLKFERVERMELNLYNEAKNLLSQIPGLKIYGHALKKAPIISFTIQGTHSSDLAQIIDQENVAVRAGHLCAQPLMRRMGTVGFVRASFSVFNNTADIEQLVRATRKAKEMLT
jgi:cysteine desulfurase/selenocysteine lyase